MTYKTTLSFLHFQIMSLPLSLLSIPSMNFRGDLPKSRKSPLRSGKPKITPHFLKRPPCLLCPMGEVVPQVIESEILDQWELVLCSLCLELAEPIVDAFFGQLRAALRDKHVGTCYITPGLQVLIERLVGFVQQIDITYLALFVTNLEPALLWINMGMGHLQPGDLTHPAARP